MRTPTEALKEIRDRLTYFCLRTDGRYDPPWATELVGIIDETTTDSHAVGNAAEMREALENIAEYAECARCHTEDAHVLGYLEQIEKWARAALSAPARQCDVGTAEELGMRYKAFCRKHFTPDQLGGNCRKCTLKDRRGWSCQLAWAQMPYEEERKGEGDGE